MNCILALCLMLSYMKYANGMDISIGWLLTTLIVGLFVNFVLNSERKKDMDKILDAIKERK